MNELLGGCCDGWGEEGGIVAASYKKVEVYFLVGSHSFPSGCCGQKKAPLSGASPPQMSLSKKHLRMHYGHAPLPPTKQLFQSLMFFWMEERPASISFDPIFLFLCISNFVFLLHKKSCILLYLFLLLE